MAGKTILVLGGGMGGVVAVNELRKRLGPEHRIAVVNRTGQHLFSPSLPGVLAGWRRAEEITKDLRRMVRPGVEVIQREILSLDRQERRVAIEGQVLQYDYLVVALGAEPAPEALPGYAEAAHNFFSLEGVARLRHSLNDFSGGRVALVVSALPYKCPAAPYEAALLLHDVFRRRKMQGKVDLRVFTPEALPMPVAGPVLGGMVKGMLEEGGISFHPNGHRSRVGAVRPGAGNGVWG